MSETTNKFPLVTRFVTDPDPNKWKNVHEILRDHGQDVEGAMMHYPHQDPADLDEVFRNDHHGEKRVYVLEDHMKERDWLLEVFRKLYMRYTDFLPPNKQRPNAKELRFAPVVIAAESLSQRATIMLGLDRVGRQLAKELGHRVRASLRAIVLIERSLSGHQSRPIRVQGAQDPRRATSHIPMTNVNYINYLEEIEREAAYHEEISEAVTGSIPTSLIPDDPSGGFALPQPTTQQHKEAHASFGAAIERMERARHVATGKHDPLPEEALNGSGKLKGNR